VLNGTATPNATLGTLGDFYIETDENKIYGPKATSGANGGWGSGTSLKGSDGSPWTAGGTLPATGTLTGTYAIPGSKFSGLASAMEEKDEPIYVPISFSVPVEPIPTFVFVPPSGEHFGTDAAHGCPGVVGGLPQADPGKLCVYGTVLNFFGGFLTSTATVTTVTPEVNTEGSPPDGVVPAGTVLKLTCPAGAEFGYCVGKGVWAVSGS